MTSIDLGTIAGAVVDRFVEQGASPIEHPRGLGAGVDEAEESVVKTRCAQRFLTGVAVDVELTTLPSRVRRGVEIVDGAGDAVNVENARESETAQSGADDGDGGMLIRDAHETTNMFVTNTIVKNTFAFFCRKWDIRLVKEREKKREEEKEEKPKPRSRRERPAKSALSRETVVGAALRILKKEGLEKVTMRSIAAALDTGPASLYVYVQDTRDLHGQILDALLAELPAPKPGKHWRRDLEQVTEAFLDVLMRYPEIARLTMAAAPSGPNALRLFDTLAGLLLQGGATARDAAWGVDLVLAYVTATAVEHGGHHHEDADHLEGIRRALENLDAKTHPNLARLHADLLTGEGLERFRWGLGVLVKGLLRGSKDER